MNIENILIEGVVRGNAFGDINDEEIDISCSDESLLNQRYFLTIYKTDEELNKQEQIGRIEMTYIDDCDKKNWLDLLEKLEKSIE